MLKINKNKGFNILRESLELLPGVNVKSNSDAS